jgi:hypothetical protein
MTAAHKVGDQISRTISILIFIQFVAHAEAAERIYVDTIINGKPAKLELDTGTGLHTLWRNSAETLGLQIMWHTNMPYLREKIYVGVSESCDFTFLGKTRKTEFQVVDMPSDPIAKEAGLLGWRDLHLKIIKFDCLNKRFSLLSEVPKEASSWLKFDLRNETDILAFLIPLHTRLDGEQGIVCIDTGSDDGICLSSELWREWKNVHTNRNKTISSYYMLGTGLMIQEISWAKTFSLDKLTFTDVPLSEANAAEYRAGWPKYVASLGMAALSRLDFIVDGRNGVIYLLPKKSPAPAVDHNRAGVVFIWPNANKSGKPIAHVVDGTPAYEAGIRDGDVLLSANEADSTNFPIDLAQADLKFRNPSGTKFNLLLKRGDKEFQTTVVLRDLIGPNISSAKKCN